MSQARLFWLNCLVGRPKPVPRNDSVTLSPAGNHRRQLVVLPLGAGPFPLPSQKVDQVRTIDKKVQTLQAGRTN